MKLPIISISFGSITLSVAENRKIIKTNLAEASAFDLKAAKHLKEGNYEKAAYYAVLSQEHLRLASKAKVEDIKFHALYN